MPGKSRLNQDQIKESHSKRLPELIPQVRRAGVILDMIMGKQELYAVNRERAARVWQMGRYATANTAQMQTG